MDGYARIGLLLMFLSLLTCQTNMFFVIFKNTFIKKRMVKLIKKYVDVFAWSYQDMPGLDTDIVEHKLPLKPKYSPVKQKLRRTHPDITVKIKEEV